MSRAHVVTLKKLALGYNPWKKVPSCRVLRSYQSLVALKTFGNLLVRTPVSFDSGFHCILPYISVP